MPVEFQQIFDKLSGYHSSTRSNHDAANKLAGWIANKNGHGPALYTVEQIPQARQRFGSGQ